MEDLLALLGFGFLLAAGLCVGFGLKFLAPFEEILESLDSIEEPTEEERDTYWRYFRCMNELENPFFVASIPFFLFGIVMLITLYDPCSEGCLLLLAVPFAGIGALLYIAHAQEKNIDIRHKYGIYDTTADIQDHISAGICLHGVFKITKNALGSNKRQTEYFKNSKNKV